MSKASRTGFGMPGQGPPAALQLFTLPIVIQRRLQCVDGYEILNAIGAANV